MIKTKIAIYSPSYAEIWNRIIYYGLQSTLVIYLITYLNFTSDKAYQIYGIYTALTLGFSILGGIVADKIIGYYYSVILGSILVLVGNVALCCGSSNIAYLAMAAIAVGIGLFKPNNPNLLAKIITSNLENQDKQFSIYYMFINVGSLVGPLFYGYFINSQYYKFAFLFASLGMLSGIFLIAALSINTKYRKSLTQKLSLSASICLSFLIIISIVLSSMIIRSEALARIFLVIFFVTGLFYIISIIRSLTHDEKNRLNNLIVPVIGSVIFFAFLLQIYTSILTYNHQYVSAILFGFKIPSPWFSSLEPLFLILSVPLLTSFWSFLDKKKIWLSVNNKILIGLLFTCISFMFFSMETLTPGNSSVNIILMMIANVFLALAELFILPVTIALITAVAPVRYKATVMACFYAVLALSSYLSSFLAQLSTKNIMEGLVGYTHSFVLMALAILVVTVVLFMVSKKVKIYE
jgi:POT family proton-dependent oligopeptide transporter